MEFRDAAIRTVRDARQGGAYIHFLYVTGSLSEQDGSRWEASGSSLLCYLYPVTPTAATCFATPGGAAVGSTTFAAGGSGTRRCAAAGLSPLIY